MPFCHVEPFAGLHLDICNLLANFQKISFNVKSKVSVKGMDDDDGQDCNEDNDNINDHIVGATPLVDSGPSNLLIR